jgi:hypothetical protein
MHSYSFHFEEQRMVGEWEEKSGLHLFGEWRPLHAPDVSYFIISSLIVFR